MTNEISQLETHSPESSLVERVPLVEEISPVPDVYESLCQFANLEGTILFESSRQGEKLGRYSFLSADPFRSFQVADAEYGFDPFAKVRAEWNRYRCPKMNGLPPFQGGVAGYLSYELGECWERVSKAGGDEFRFPAMSLGIYDWVLAWDHILNRAWIVSHGWPEIDLAKRKRKSRERLSWVRERLSTPSDRLSDEFCSQQKRPCLINEQAIPQFSLDLGPDGLRSDFSRNSYIESVERVIEYIHAGDIFQTNLTQRLLIPQKESSVELYGKLRKMNPAPFAGYYSAGEWSLLSSSPERFLKIEDRIVLSRPIKGTRQRFRSPEIDLLVKDELLESEKDRAENVMIVDLLRNDLSRVSKPGSISVPELCTVESYEAVQHLVSEIRGELKSDVTPWDVWAATFPGGSITGAPKVRAMEIIAELEPTVRGPYCGSLFWLGFDGRMDSNLLIRTLLCKDGWVQCPVGGGIVALSNPEDEYEETLHKAEAMLRVFS